MDLVPTSLAVNADTGIHRDRLMTHDELIEYMRQQIEAAAKLGFPIARVQISIEPDSMEALAPIAEEHGVTLALEVHADQYARHPRILKLRDRFEKVGSPFLGFTMDWGATVSGFAPSLIEAYRRRGASEELLGKVVDLWNTTTSRARRLTRPSTASASARSSASPRRTDVRTSESTSASTEPACSARRAWMTWLEIFPWIRHVHGKFFGIDENGEEPSVPGARSDPSARGERLLGAISSEYEGWHWNYWQSPFEIIRGEQAVQRSAAADAGSAHDHGCRRGAQHPQRPPGSARPRLKPKGAHTMMTTTASPARASSSASPSTRSPPSSPPASTRPRR